MAFEELLTSSFMEGKYMNYYLAQYIKPELLILVPVLFAAGILLKKTRVKDYNIPLILGIIGTILSMIWVISTSLNFSWQGVLAEIFTGITQGILTAAVSVYVNQLIKQGQQAQACKLCEEVKKNEKCAADIDKENISYDAYSDLKDKQ
jgi:hypothetical protein